MESAAWRPVSMPHNRQALQAGCHHVSVNTQATRPIPGPQAGSLELDVWGTDRCTTVLEHFGSLSGLL